MGISRDTRHKRRATGGKRKAYRKKRKFEMGRPPANTKIGEKRIHLVRTRGGGTKYRALRLETGNFSWGSESVSRKTRIFGVVYNASNNELVRTNTLVKNCIIQVDAAPFRLYYEQFYGATIGKKRKLVSKTTKSSKSTKKSKDDAKKGDKAPVKGAKAAAKAPAKGAKAPAKGAKAPAKDAKAAKAPAKAPAKGAKAPAKDAKAAKAPAKAPAKGAKAPAKDAKAAKAPAKDAKAAKAPAKDAKAAKAPAKDAKAAKAPAKDAKAAKAPAKDAKAAKEAEPAASEPAKDAKEVKEVKEKTVKKRKGLSERDIKAKKAHVALKKLQATRRRGARVAENLVEQFATGRILVCVSSRPGQSGRCDGYVLEGKELDFYQKKIAQRKKSK